MTDEQLTSNLRDLMYKGSDVSLIGLFIERVSKMAYGKKKKGKKVKK